MLARWQSEFAAALFDRSGPPGMAQYRANVFGNWADALAGAYPIVRKIVGEEFFRGLAYAYARAHPSTSGDLGEYGAELAAFVARFPPTLDLPYLPDVARMEWLAHRAYYAADPAPFSHIASRVRLAPTCALLASPWPLERIWTVHQDDYEGEFDVDLRAGPERILVYRPRWRVQVRRLEDADYRFLCNPDRLDVAAARWIEAGVLTPCN